jgi:site-specific DNA-cytosine methylase
MVERKNNKEQLDKHDNMDFISRKYQEFILKNGYIPKLFNPYNCTELNDYAPTQTAQGASVTKSSSILIYDNNRLRRHTSLESMLLMGFSREDYNKIKEMGISDTQIYRLAGNSIVVNVLYYIFKKLFNK